MRKIIFKIMCSLGFHNKNSIESVDDWMRGTIDKNLFQSGRTSYWKRTCRCDRCGEVFSFKWSYPTPYEEWSWRRDGSWIDWNGKKRDVLKSYRLER